jgi:hypothetical protein
LEHLGVLVERLLSKQHLDRELVGQHLAEEIALLDERGEHFDPSVDVVDLSVLLGQLFLPQHRGHRLEDVAISKLILWGFLDRRTTSAIKELV